MSRLVSGDAYSGSEAYAWPLPRRGAADQLLYPELCFSVRPGNRPLFLDLHIPRPKTDGGYAESPAPVVIWLHGGGFERGSRNRHEAEIEAAYLTERLLMAGFAVADIDYRLVREAIFPEPLWDVRTALGWLARNCDELGLDFSRLALFGESSGGTLAMLGSLPHEWTPQVRCAVSWYGMADTAWLDIPIASDAPEVEPMIRKGLQRGGWEGPEASMLAQANGVTPPQLLAFGSDDNHFIVDSNRALAARLQNLGREVEVVEVSGGRVFQNLATEPAKRYLDPQDSLNTVLTRTIKFLAKHLETEIGPGALAGISDEPAQTVVAETSKANGATGRRVEPVETSTVTINVLDKDLELTRHTPASTPQALVFYNSTNEPFARRLAATIPAKVLQLENGVEEAISVLWWAGENGADLASGSEMASEAHSANGLGEPDEVDNASQSESPSGLANLPVILAGDCEGGQVALEAAKRCRDAGIHVDALGLLCPILTEDDLNPETLVGLPPTIIGVGVTYPKLADSLALGYRLRAAGVPSKLQLFGKFICCGGVGFSCDKATDRAVQTYLQSLSTWVWQGTLN